MCGRYSLAQAGLLPEIFGIDEVQIPPRFNIAPTQDVPVIRLIEDGRRRLDMLRWGLVPSWSKDPRNGARMINARSETVHEKPAFRDAFQRRHCLIPADGFFEWCDTPLGRQPFYIQLQDWLPFAFTGLWEQWGISFTQVVSFYLVQYKGVPYARHAYHCVSLKSH